MGAPTGIRVAYYKSATTWAARVFAIYLRKEREDELLQALDITSLMEYDPSSITNAVVTQNVRSLTRRRYPGGPAISVPAGKRQRVTGPNYKYAVWPGRPIYIETPEDGSVLDPSKSNVDMFSQQITLDGSFPEFYKFCQANCVKSFILRSNNGRPIYIKKAGPPPPGVLVA